MEVLNESLYVTTVFCLRLLWDTIYDGWAKISSDMGLTVTEEQVLWAIWLFDSSTVTEVASRLQRDKGTISKCIYSLEESGLVLRKAGVDRRSYEFKITEEGEKLRQRLSVAHGCSSPVSQAFAKLTDAEQKMFLSLVAKLSQHIEGEAYVSEVIHHLARVDAAITSSAGNV